MLFVAQSATSGRSCGGRCTVYYGGVLCVMAFLHMRVYCASRRSFGTDKQDSNSTVAFLARSWQVMGRFVVKSC